MADMTTDIGGITIKNPVITASGTFGYGVDFVDFMDLSLLGGISVKGLHVDARIGNAPQRIMETPCGMLNAIGLQGIGIEAFARDKMPVLRQYDTAIIVNFWGTTNEEYEEAVRQLNDVEGIAGLEVNVSCPNVKAGGMTFGTDPQQLGQLIGRVRKLTKLPLMVKLSPNVTSIPEMARIVEGEGADSISLVNTFSAMMIDVDTRRPYLSNVVGGLSGPAIRPIAVRMTYEAANAVKIPIIGMGGIMCARDALEFLIAGAAAVQVGTASFVNPTVALDVIRGIEEYLEAQQLPDIASVVGSIKLDG